jgi:hypothetical protein
MSDGLSRIELKTASYGRSYHDEAEDRGLLGTAPDPAAMSARDVENTSSEVQKSYDDNDLLPVMIENRLEQMGCL